jgi:hypothetical protein
MYLCIYISTCIRASIHLLQPCCVRRHEKPRKFVFHDTFGRSTAHDFFGVHGISILRSFEFKKPWIYSVYPKMYGNFGENDDEPIEGGVPHFWISASKISWPLTFSHFELIGQIPPKTIGTKHTRFCRLGCSGLIQLRHNFHTSTLSWVSSIILNHDQSSSIILNHHPLSYIIIIINNPKWNHQ